MRSLRVTTSSSGTSSSGMPSSGMYEESAKLFGGGLMLAFWGTCKPGGGGGGGGGTKEVKLDMQWWTLTQ